MVWSLIGSIGGKIVDIFGSVVEDKDEANRLNFEIQHKPIENKSNELEATAKIVLAEARGSRLQRNWRPLINGYLCRSGRSSLVWLHGSKHPEEIEDQKLSN